MSNNLPLYSVNLQSFAKFAPFWNVKLEKLNYIPFKRQRRTEMFAFRRRNFDLSCLIWLYSTQSNVDSFKLRKRIFTFDRHVLLIFYEDCHTIEWTGEKWAAIFLINCFNDLYLFDFFSAAFLCLKIVCWYFTFNVWYVNQRTTTIDVQEGDSPKWIKVNCLCR